MPDKRCPRCFTKINGVWLDDPIKTPKGEAGEDYIGFTYIKSIHIIELQDIRKQQEINVGIPVEERTTFTPIKIEGQKVYFYKRHLRELRESTEKILEATGQTKEDYFNYDEEGTEYNIENHQLDWHDLDLTKKFLDIKAVHIEDLRHVNLIIIPPVVIPDWNILIIRTFEPGYSESPGSWQKQEYEQCIYCSGVTWLGIEGYYTWMNKWEKWDSYYRPWEVHQWETTTFDLDPTVAVQYPALTFIKSYTDPYPVSDPDIVGIIKKWEIHWEWFGDRDCYKIFRYYSKFFRYKCDREYGDPPILENCCQNAGGVEDCYLDSSWDDPNRPLDWIEGDCPQLDVDWHDVPTETWTPVWFIARKI